MFKNIFPVAKLFLLVTLVSFQVSSDETCDAISDIDGLTTASQKFEIVSGNACETYAEITWWDYYNNGDVQKIKYGTSSSYGNEINLKPFTARKNITTTIPDLEPDTKYYIQFYRQRGSSIKPLEFTFTTQEMPTSIVTASGKSYSLAFGHQFSVIENMLFFDVDMRTGDKIFISDMKGRKIFGYVHELDISRIKLPEIKPGIYVVSKIRKNNLVNKNQVVIGLSPK